MVGRLALPIFAYMIAEGCRYTKNKKKYLLLLFAVAALCQIVYFVTLRSLLQSIMTTFLLSAIIIFAYQKAFETKSIQNIIAFISAFIGVYLVCEVLPIYVNGFLVDYGFIGVMLPFLIYLGKDKWSKLFLASCGLFLLTVEFRGVQEFAFIALIPLWFYNGKRGRARLKYFFYIYYPLHLGVIYLISTL